MTHSVGHFVMVLDKKAINNNRKIDIWGQFHQHSTRSFNARRSQMRKKDSQVSQCCLALLEPVSVKAACKTLMKLTPGRIFVVLATEQLGRYGSFQIVELGSRV